VLVPSLADAVNGLLRLDPSQRLATAKAAVLLEAVDAEIAARIEMQRQAAGLRRQGGQGVSDPLGDLTRPPQGIAIKRFVREPLYKLRVDPPHTRPLRSAGRRKRTRGGYKRRRDEQNSFALWRLERPRLAQRSRAGQVNSGPQTRNSVMPRRRSRY
jgi:hypothetical protein